ncbi:protein kinase [Streptomyces sp. NPDC093225]|uniref:serine/threonine-protein kinase n=1 Tax=Streptomyces sp. NPDC093225 TaxID=3366034 RepID=UPI0037FA9F31
MRQGDILDARYELVRRLDAGGMGEVWEGVDRRIRRPVAIKLIREEADPALVPELVERLGREATAAGRLAHPHIVAVYDYHSVEQDGVPLVYIVMELVRGRSLAEELRSGLPPLPQALAWAEQIALALEVAHGPEAGVVHRDLKPVNVMITNGGLVKLLDFGIARFMAENDTHHTRLTGGRMIGTPLYMAPEQCQAGPVDGRTDLYALGCLLYTMLTGRPPFTSEGGLLQVMYQQVHASPPPPGTLRPDVPPAVDALVMDLLAKSPGDRPADASAVVERLRALGLPTSAPAAARPVRPAPGARGPADHPAPHPPTGPAEDDPAADDLTADDPTAAVRAELERCADDARGESDPGRARALLAQLAAEAVRLLGADDPLSVEIAFDLACSTARDGQHEAAARMLAEVIPALADLHGPDDRRTLYARCLLPWYMAGAGVPADAAALYAMVVPDVRRVLGETDSLTLHTRFQHLVQLGEAGDHVQAVQLWAQLIPLLDEAERVVGTLAADARGRLAGSILELADSEEVAPRLWVLVPDLVKLLDSHEEAAYAARTVLVRWTAAAGTDRESLPAWRVLVSDSGRALGERHPLTLTARSLLAKHTEAAGDPEEAAQQLEALLPELTAAFGPDAPPVLQARFLFARASAAVDQAVGGELWHRLIPDLERVFGTRHRLPVDARFRLALGLAEDGREAEALPLLEPALRERIGLFGDGDPVNLRGRFAHARGMDLLGHRSTARHLLSALLPDLRWTLGPEHELTRAAQRWLGIGAEDPAAAAGGLA